MAVPAASDEPFDEPAVCVACGRPLGLAPDDQPDWPGGPICGDCYQARQMDDEIYLDMSEHVDAG
jgi:hypothetical protein